MNYLLLSIIKSYTLISFLYIFIVKKISLELPLRESHDKLFHFIPVFFLPVSTEYNSPYTKSIKYSVRWKKKSGK